MACPTCDHTMQRLLDPPVNLFWCPRCGTLLTAGLGSLEGIPWSVPKLVERCRDFEIDLASDTISTRSGWRRLWASLGIAESINTPDNRPGAS